MTTRHEFLAQLHELLKPKVYLEIGVQHGWSLQLSKAAKSIGIDPDPQQNAYNVLRDLEGEDYLYEMTSDEFFGHDRTDEIGKIDFAFIDGMHLAEFAWRDFVNVELYCHDKSVVVFDDVLPTTVEMATREQCPGDWTGDVWKIYFALQHIRPDLTLILVDTSPTGTLVVIDTNKYWADEFEISAMDVPDWMDVPPPAYILDRRHAWSAPAVLENLKERGFGS